MKDFKFEASDFDRLRNTLRAHLFEIMPERDHREAILNLIHDIQTVAADCANALLAAEIEKAPEVHSFKGIRETIWHPHPVGGNTHKARLICVKKL